MAYIMADFSKCEELAKKNEWVSSGTDSGSRECAVAVKALTGAPATSLWRRGKKVKGNNSILQGTAIATFPDKGSDGKFHYKGHAAIFVKHTSDGIEVYDQWGGGAVLPGQTLPGTPFHKRTIRYGGRRVSNDAEEFYVIEDREV